MMRFFIYNALVAGAFFGLWFAVNALKFVLPWQAAVLTLVVFFAGFYFVSFVTLQRRSGRGALSILSAVGWTVATVGVSVGVLISIFGGLGPCL